MNLREYLVAGSVLNEAVAEGVVEIVKGIPIVRDRGRTYLIEVTAIELSEV